MIGVLRSFGFEDALASLINRLYESTTATVRKGRITTESFATECGVIQGCPLSPHLFNLFLDKVLREALYGYEGGVRIGGEYINDLEYADDIVLMAETTEEIQQMVSMVEEKCQKYKLYINVNKQKQ